MSRRKICVVTGTRAEYGLLYCLMKEINDDADLKLQIIATGMHLSPEFGLTYRQIEDDDFVINEKIEMLLSSDTPVGMAKSIGLGVIGFADAFERLQPDIVVILGDRCEILAASQAAMVCKIPIAHIHGGELTEGVIDESIRHSVTKMAQIHFVAAEPYRKRVIQLGEHPNSVINVGAPGLDHIRQLKLLKKDELEKLIDFKFGEINFMVTYHPVTLDLKNSSKKIQAIFKAIDHFPEAKVIFTKANSDPEGREINNNIERYAMQNKNRVKVFTSMGQLRYLSTLQYIDVVVGNSSSGIIEVPMFKKPTVNIGTRQKGRLKAASVIDCTENEARIKEAIFRALSPEFRNQLSKTVSVYGQGDASKQMKEHLKEANLKGILKKPFFDIESDL